MKISIITTVKNGSKYILETLDSIKNQTFQDFEHIIIDDGSTDETVELLEIFRNQNPNYKLHLFQPGNLGRGKALNFAVSKTKNDWIAIIDADDIWHPRKLEAQIQILQNNPHISVLATKAGLFSDTVSYNEYKEFSFQIIDPKKMLYKSMISHSSVIIKKKDATYDETRLSQFDAELWYRLAFDEKKVIAIVDQELNFHRIHENQSFEGKMKKIYRIRSFKLKAKYCLKQKMYSTVFYNFSKLMFDLVFTRSFRLFVKKNITR